MALNFKVLGQSTSLTGNSNIILYGVPYYTSTVVSTLNVCNYGSGTATFDIAFRKGGANLTSKHYFSYRTPIAAYESIGITAGITLDQADLVVVSANTANVSFNLFGTENFAGGGSVFPAMEYLIIGGGGNGGGGSTAGGGGGGGFRSGSITAPMTGIYTYTIIVGAGGSNASNIEGGYLSSKIESAGGGAAGQNGGSGGGNGGLGNVPATTPRQGYDGGTAFNGQSGGGGGAGAAGSGLNGGIGAYSSITGTSLPYSGGGGGSYSGGTGGNGGDGGGGLGVGFNYGGAGYLGNGVNGGTNTGGGGGGSGSGGSGVVIVRYANTLPAATTTGSPTITSANGYQIYKFTSSGSLTV